MDGAHTVTVAATGGHGYPYRAHCRCGWVSKSYVSTHAAELMGFEHAENHS